MKWCYLKKRKKSQKTTRYPLTVAAIPRSNFNKQKVHRDKTYVTGKFISPKGWFHLLIILWLYNEMGLGHVSCLNLIFCLQPKGKSGMCFKWELCIARVWVISLQSDIYNTLFWPMSKIRILYYIHMHILVIFFEIIIIYNCNSNNYESVTSQLVLNSPILIFSAH